MSFFGRTGSLAIAVLMAASGFAVAASLSTDVTYDSHQVLIEQGEVHAKLSVAGTHTTKAPGAPSLPVQYLRFVIPADSRVDDLVVSFGEQELSGSYRVEPAQPEVPMGEPPQRVGEDESVYGSDAPYPAARVEYLGDGFLGGYRIATVAVHPVQYLPKSGRLVLATDISVELQLAPDTRAAHPRTRMTAGSDELYRKVVEGLVENPRDVAGKLRSVDVVDAVGTEGFQPRYTPSLEGSPVEYVIITSEEFEPYFQSLADWKTKKGVPTVIRSVAWIEENYHGGVDATERIRFFIQDAYESWGTTYILLGGDTSIVPIRYCWSAYSGEGSLATDLYYSDLDGNWNLDGDSEFGEPYLGMSAPGDSVDLYPDVFVGRASVTSSVEVETFVTKTLAYEKNPASDFGHLSLYLAEVLFPYDWEYPGYITTDGAEHIVEPALPLVPGWIQKTLLYQNYHPFPDSDELTEQVAVDSINAGYNLVSHVGHGSKDVLRCSKNQYLNFQDIDELSNGTDRSGFFWMLNCTSTAVDYDCMSEHLMNNPGGGATFVYGPTRVCYPTTTKDYYYTWHEQFYGGTDRAGVVGATSKVPYVPLSGYDNTDRWTQLTYLLLGDPESRLWTDAPVALTAIHDSSVPLGPTDLTVTVVDPAAVDSAYVCVVKDDEVYVTGYTDGAGQVTLSFTPQTTGTMTITITARNHYPYEDTIGVTTSASAHLTLRSTTVNDDGVGGSDGNANGHAEAGETVELSVTVGNGGLSDATDVTATLTTVDPYVTLIDDAESLGVVGASSQVAYPNAFVVAIADSCPNDHDVEFTLALEESARGNWTDSYTLKVLRPILTQLRNDYDDGGDGIPEVGETVTLTVTVLNEGNGEADIVSGELNYGSSEVTITDSLGTWGDIAPGATAVATGGFAFTINDTLTQDLELVLTDEDGKAWVHAFDVVAPGVPTGLDGRVKATTIYLMWDPAPDSDLWGYHVYRTDHPFGTFEQINSSVVEGISYYEDQGLAENQKYYYKVSAVDLSGNVGDLSDDLEITTNPPAQAGWPLRGGEAMYGSPVAVDTDLDGDLELLVGSGHVYGWHHTGVEVTDGDGDPRTEGVLAADGTGGYRSSVAVGELDGDAYPEIVGCAWGDVGEPGDPIYEVWAWNAEDGTPLGGSWPATTSRLCWATPTLADLDHDGLDEVIVPCANTYLYVWNHDGTGFLNPDGTFASIHASWAYGSAAVADLDRDNDLEIVVPSRSDSVYCFNPDGTYVPGWPVDLGGDARGSIAIGDVDNDGLPDVVATSNNNLVWVLTGSGTTFPDWPVSCPQTDDFASSPTLADLDGDDDLEIILVGSNGQVHVWTWEGDPFTGWPQTMDGAGLWDKRSSAVVGDVDGDAELEILTGASNGKVYAFNADGSLASGWPIQTDAEVYSTPTLADLDLDGDMEVVVSGMDEMVYVWDTEGNYAGGDGVEWGCYRYDASRSGLYGGDFWVGVADDGTWSVSGPRLEQNMPNPFNPVTTIVYSAPEGGGDIDLAVFNVAGERVATLAAGRVDAGRRTATWDGTDTNGAPVASGIYFVKLAAGETSLTRKIALLK